MDALSADLGASFVAKVERSAEVEKQMAARIAAVFNPSDVDRAEGSATKPSGAPPAFSYIGIFAGAEKPKPFQRKRASLTSNPTNKLPSASTMRRLSMSSTQERKKGSREEFALQHIHEGRNVFKVMMAGGVRKDLVMEDTKLSVVLNALSAEPNKLDVVIPYSQIDQYELQGEKVALATKPGTDAGSDEQTTYFFNTGDPMHMIHTLVRVVCLRFSSSVPYFTRLWNRCVPACMYIRARTCRNSLSISTVHLRDRNSFLEVLMAALFRWSTHCMAWWMRTTLCPPSLRSACKSRRQWMSSLLLTRPRSPRQGEAVSEARNLRGGVTSSSLVAGCTRRVE